MFKTDKELEGVELTPAEAVRNQRTFAWLLGFMPCEFKFIYQILAMMTKVPKPGLGTLGVTVANNKMILHYDPVVVFYLDEAELTYIFYHEVLHVALHHCTKRPLTTDKSERAIAGIAHDLAINCLIDKAISNGHQKTCKVPLFSNGKICGQHVSEYRKMKEFADMELDQTAEYYYDYLRKKRDALEKKFGCDGDCANCKLEKSNENGGGDGTVIPKKDCPKFDDHGGWSESGNEILEEKIRAKIASIRSSDSWGTMEAGMKETILAAQIKKINWRNLIRVWFGNHSWPTRMNTRKKPNRRTGFIHPGTRKSFVDEYLVAIDTSGSIDSELLAEFLAVLNQLLDYLPIHIMQFDWVKQTDPVPYNRRMTQFNFQGRGGTNFEPVMEVVAKRRYKGVMILTDGCAGKPSKPNAHVLWVMPIGCEPPVEWGTRIYMEKHT